MTVLNGSVVIPGTNRQGLVNLYRQLLAAEPLAEFPLPGRDLVVTAFAGLSVLTGSAESLAPVRDLRATMLVDSLSQTEAQLLKSGWSKEGSLNPATSLLFRDPEGNLLEFVEESDHPAVVDPH